MRRPPRRGRIPLSLSGAGAVLYGGRYVVLVGGVHLAYDGRSLGFSRRLFAYDLRRRSWWRLRQDRPISPHFNDPAVGLIGDRLYVAGNEGDGGSHWNESWTGRIRLR